jgi:hypothetical protein
VCSSTGTTFYDSETVITGAAITSVSATHIPGFNLVEDTGRKGAHTINIVAVWDYPISTAAVSALQDDPFCMLKG